MRLWINVIRSSYKFSGDWPLGYTRRPGQRLDSLLSSSLFISLLATTAPSGCPGHARSASQDPGHVRRSRQQSPGLRAQRTWQVPNYLLQLLPIKFLSHLQDENVIDPDIIEESEARSDPKTSTSGSRCCTKRQRSSSRVFFRRSKSGSVRKRSARRSARSSLGAGVQVFCTAGAPCTKAEIGRFKRHSLNAAHPRAAFTASLRWTCCLVCLT